MLANQDERSDKLTAVAKKKLHKYQSKKVTINDNLEQENIRLKERLFKSEEQVELMQHGIKCLREKNSELQRLMVSDFLTDREEDINFSDHHTLEAYEKEERLIFENLKKMLHDLRERFKRNSTELCSNCMGEMIEI